jgi:hypothetical protein
MASEIGVEEEDLVPVPLIGRAPPFRASIKSIWASSNKLASCLFLQLAAPRGCFALGFRDLTSATFLAFPTSALILAAGCCCSRFEIFFDLGDARLFAGFDLLAF